MKIACIGCGKTPSEIEEYVYNPEDDPDATHFVVENEGTYNASNGHFTCTDCYIRLGMPSSPHGWIAP